MREMLCIVLEQGWFDDLSFVRKVLYVRQAADRGLGVYDVQGLIRLGLRGRLLLYRGWLLGDLFSWFGS